MSILEVKADNIYQGFMSSFTYREQLGKKTLSIQYMCPQADWTIYIWMQVYIYIAGLFQEASW